MVRTYELSSCPELPIHEGDSERQTLEQNLPTQRASVSYVGADPGGHYRR
jgi:hypothetical protein